MTRLVLILLIAVAMTLPAPLLCCCTFNQVFGWITYAGQCEVSLTAKNADGDLPLCCRPATNDDTDAPLPCDCDRSGEIAAMSTALSTATGITSPRDSSPPSSIQATNLLLHDQRPQSYVRIVPRCRPAPPDTPVKKCDVLLM